MKKEQKAYVVAVDMGYGHQRAADPLREIAYHGEVINANNYPGIPAEDKKIWHDSRRGYEFISRFKKVPLIGDVAFGLFDKFQEIPPFYPKRDLSDPNIQLRYMYHLIKNHDWGKHLIKKLNRKPLPLITTFFVTAFMAEIYGYSGDIYAVITDTDISRTWVPLDPEKSRIKYFAPSKRAFQRLKRYGVRSENIYLTGFPLATELLGKSNLSIVRKDLNQRLINLDPKKVYCDRYQHVIKENIGKGCLNAKKSDHPLTLMFAVGGAGAQRELGMAIVKSLKMMIRRKRIRVFLVAGTYKDIKGYFSTETKALGLEDELGTGVKIIYSARKDTYFKAFNKAMRKTDILWTKPSELSFYTALGMPIVMSPPIGSQEKFNRQWLMKIGSAIEQQDPANTSEWLFDLLESGWFAEAAMNGFLEAPKFGTENIKKVINSSDGVDLTTLHTEMEY